MKARRCQGCAAPLPDGDGPDALRCRFCGLVHERAAPASGGIHVHTIQLRADSLKRPMRWVALAIVVITLGALVPVIATVYFGWRAATAIATSSGPRSFPKPAVLSPTGLRSAAAGVHDLDAAGPSSGFSALDAVSAVPWALSIAQSWSADARLERIDVTRLRPDGTVNVQDDGEALVRYRFESPGRIAALLEQARLSQSAKSNVGLFLVAQGGKLKAQVIESSAGTQRGSDAPPPHPSVMPLHRLVVLPAVEKLLDAAPFLSAYLIHIADEGWVWYFSTLDGASKPRVRGRDGAVWPYPRARTR
jgi:hypothetical protein